ncbi:hypothetical protein PJN26_29670, partial [Mycobacterium kansasii]
MVNPRENVSAITLKNGKCLGEDSGEKGVEAENQPQPRVENRSRGSDSEFEPRDDCTRGQGIRDRD